jgi:hypothetical protein
LAAILASCARFKREVERAHTNLFDRSDPPQERVPPAEVQIHGLWCNGKDTRDAVKRCHKHNWHWQKALWQPRDIVANRKTGKRSFELTLVTTPPISTSSGPVGRKIIA